MKPLFKITILAATTALITAPASAPSYAQGGDFQSCLQTINADAVRQGVPAAIAEAALRNLTPDQKIVDLDSKQPEFSLTYAKYVGSTVSNDCARKWMSGLRVCVTSVRIVVRWPRK